MRKVGVYALILLGIIGVIALLPGVPSVRSAILERVVAQLDDKFTITYAQSSGNMWQSIALEDAVIEHPDFGALAIDELHVSYYLPAIIAGELPLTIIANGITGDVSFEEALATDSTCEGWLCPTILPRNVDISGLDVNINHTPFEFASFNISEVRVSQPNARTIEASGVVTTEHGFVRASAEIDIQTGTVSGDIHEADIGVARTWWDLIRSGSGHGAFQFSNGEITANLFVTGGEIDLLDLELNDISGLVQFTYPELTFDVQTNVLGGSGDMTGSVDFVNELFIVDGPASAPLANLGDWIARISLPNGLPVPLTGTANVDILVHGWDQVRVEATGSAAGTLLTYPLTIDNLDFTYFESGQMTVDADVQYTGAPMDVTMRPVQNGTDLRVSSDAISFFTPGDTQIQVYSHIDSGTIEATAQMNVPIGTEVLRLLADFDGQPDAYSLYVDGVMNDETLGTGAFAVDGLGVLGGQLQLSLPLIPDAEPLRAVGTVSGTLTEATVELHTEGPAMLSLPLFGMDFEALDPRGTLQAQVTTAGFTNITGNIGTIDVHDGFFSFVNSTGNAQLSGEASPSIGDIDLLFSLDNLTVSFDETVAFDGRAGVDFPALPSALEFTASYDSESGFQAQSLDNTLRATYGSRGVRIDAENTEVVLGDAAIRLSAGVREIDGEFHLQALLPAGTNIAGLTLRNDANATSIIDPAGFDNLQFVGTSGGQPFQVDVRGDQVHVHFSGSETNLTVGISDDSPITLTGNTAIATIDQLFCIMGCESSLSIDGALEAEFAVDPSDWTYDGNFTIALNTWPIRVEGTTDADGAIDVAVFLSTASSPLIETSIPAGTPPVELFDTLFSGTLSAFDFGGITLSPMDWTATWDAATQRATVSLPGGEIILHASGGTAVVSGAIQLPVSAGGFDFFVSANLTPTSVEDFTQANIDATLATADGTTLLTVEGTPQELTGTFAFTLAELGAIAGIDGLSNLYIDGDNILTGDVVIQPLDGGVVAQAEIGNISGTGGIQNALPYFALRTAGAEITFGDGIALELVGSLDQDSPLDAQLSYTEADVRITADLSYTNNTVFATIPGHNITVPLVEATGAIELSYSLSTSELTSSGELFSQIGNEVLSLNVHNPTNALDNLGLNAKLGEFLAQWRITDPQTITVVGPAVDVAASIGSGFSVEGTAFDYPFHAVVAFGDVLTALITAPDLPGTVELSYIPADNSVTGALRGDVEADFSATISTEGIAGEINAIGQTVQIHVPIDFDMAFLTHQFGNAAISLPELSWTAEVEFETDDVVIQAAIRGELLEATLDGSLSIAGFTAAIDGVLENSEVRAQLISEEIVGSIVTGVLQYNFGDPLDTASVDLHVDGTIEGTGSLTLDDEVATLHASLGSTILPEAGITLYGTYTDDFEIEATGTGQLRGQVAYSSGGFTGELLFANNALQADVIIISDDAHVTVSTPFLPTGQLISIVNLSALPTKIVFDGLGALVGEVVVDIPGESIDLRNLSIRHELGTLTVNQVVPFSGPYDLSGAIALDVVDATFPVSAQLGTDDVFVQVFGSTGVARAKIPLTGIETSDFLVELDDFALPLSGAEAFPLSGEAIVSVGPSSRVEVVDLRSGSLDLVSEAGYVSSLAVSLGTDDSFTVYVNDTQLDVAISDAAVHIRERESGGELVVGIESQDNATTVNISAPELPAMLAAIGLPITTADLTGTVTITPATIGAHIALTNVSADTVPFSIESLELSLPDTPLDDVLSQTLHLASVIHVGAIVPLEFIGTAYLDDGVPTVDVISSTGQVLSGTVWPVHLTVSSVGTVDGEAVVTPTGIEVRELLLELANVRMLLDGSLSFEGNQRADFLGQLAFRDAGSEYPATVFQISGDSREYVLQLGDTESGITANVSIEQSLNIFTRIQATNFFVPIPAVANMELNGDLYVSGNTVSGNVEIGIEGGSVEFSGSLPLTDLQDLLSDASSAHVEMLVHQLDLKAVSFLPKTAAIDGTVSGNALLRGGTLIGQVLVPDFALGGLETYLEVFVYGANGTIEAATQIAGSSLSATLTNRTLGAIIHLEQFPIHEIVNPIVGTPTHDIYATGLARFEVPLDNIAGSYARLATEAVTLVNREDGRRGAIDISAVYENERLELHSFDVTGLGAWKGEGVLSADELDFHLVVKDAQLDIFTAFFPVLQPFDPGLSGSFEVTASGSITEPRISFDAPILAARFAGTTYELLDTDFTLQPSGFSFKALLTGSEQLSGELAISGAGAVGENLFDLLDIEIDLAGDFAIPTVGLIDQINGRVSIPQGGVPTLNLEGYMGNRLELAGSLAPLDLQLTGSNIQLALPILMVQDTRVNPNIRVYVTDNGLTVSGEVRADFLTLNPGLRVERVQVAEETGVANPLSSVYLNNFRLIVPQRLSFVNSLATIEGEADITAHGPISNLELEGSASAIRGSIRFSGRDFELVETTVNFTRTSGIYPTISILARTTIDKQRITSGRDDIVFIQPTEGSSFNIDLLIQGAVTPAPLELGGFTFDVVPILTSNALLEIDNPTGGRRPYTFTNDELLTLAVLGRLDIASSMAGSSMAGTALAQGVIDSALDIFIVAELERAIKTELGLDLFQLRTSSLSSLVNENPDPFGVSLKVGGYIDDGLFATYEISTLDRSQYGPVLMNQVGLQYDLGPVVFDIAARVYSPNNVTLFETVPELGVTVRYDITDTWSAEGAVDFSADRFAFRVGMTFVW